MVSSNLQPSWNLAPSTGSGWAWRDTSAESQPFMCTVTGVWKLVFSDQALARMTMTRSTAASLVCYLLVGFIDAKHTLNQHRLQQYTCW